MRFAFLAPPLPGHLNPLLALAAELRVRGHSTVFVGQADIAPIVEKGGAEHAIVGGASHPLGAIEARIQRMRRLFATIRDSAADTDMLCREAPALLSAAGAEALIVDQMEPAGGLVAAALGLPYASVATALPIDREVGVPPPYVGWRYDPTPYGLWRNRGGWRVADRLMRPVGDVLRHHARRFGLPQHGRADDWLSPRLAIAQSVPAIDFPRQLLPAHFHYVGPLRTGPTPAGAADRRIAYCALGTLQGHRAHLFAKATAAARAAGLDPLIAHGGRLDEAAAARLARQAEVHAWVDQPAVLARARLAIVHGGLNTVLDALAAGVPLVVVPLAFEQPAIAARLARAGVARIATPRGLKRAVAALIADPEHAARARGVAAQIAAAGGTVRAADLIEARLGGGTVPPVAATTARPAPGDARDDSRSGSS